MRHNMFEDGPRKRSPMFEEDREKMMEDDGDMSVFGPVDRGSILLNLTDYPELEDDREGDEVVLMVKGTVARREGGKIEMDFTQADVVHGRKDGKFIQRAIKSPGALRRTAKREGLLKGDESLSESDLDALESKARKSGNTTLFKRASLARTLKGIHGGK